MPPQDSRRVFIETLCELAEADASIVLIVGDVGFSYVTLFQEKFPDRYFNFGVTEQSMIIIAAGLALSGWKPYVYSMINFVAFRPFEMVRNAIAMHHAPVTLLGVKGSAAYNFYGFSHNMLFEDEDIYHLSKYLYCAKPATADEVRNEIRKAYSSNKPAYIRL